VYSFLVSIAYCFGCGLLNGDLLIPDEPGCQPAAPGSTGANRSENVAGLAPPVAAGREITVYPIVEATAARRSGGPLLRPFLPSLSGRLSVTVEQSLGRFSAPPSPAAKIPFPEPALRAGVSAGDLPREEGQRNGHVDLPAAAFLTMLHLNVGTALAYMLVKVRPNVCAAVAAGLESGRLEPESRCAID
jgi:hypothetical protein